MHIRQDKAQHASSHVPHKDVGLTGFFCELNCLSGITAWRQFRRRREQESSFEAPTVSWRYDERRASLVLGMVRPARPEWEGDVNEGDRLHIWGAGLTRPDVLRRSKEQNKAASRLLDLARFLCSATTMHLPEPAPGSDGRSTPVPWTIRSGVQYWRQAGLIDRMLRTS
jgi:hypothetical protein